MFELERYQYSHSLPSMMSGLPSGLTKCYFAAKNNYMIWKPAALSGPGHYQVYFDIYLPEIQSIGTTLLILYVQSAFLRTVPHTEQREKFTPFVAICGKLAGVVESKKKVRVLRPKARKSLLECETKTQKPPRTVASGSAVRFLLPRPFQAGGSSHRLWNLTLYGTLELIFHNFAQI